MQKTTKTHASPLLQAVAIPRPRSSASQSATGGSTRRRLAPKKTKRPQGIAPVLFFMKRQHYGRLVSQPHRLQHLKTF